MVTYGDLVAHVSKIYCYHPQSRVAFRWAVLPRYSPILGGDRLFIVGFAIKRCSRYNQIEAMPDKLKSKRLLYNQQEVADMLDVSVRTLSNLARSGDIRFISIGNQRRFAMSDIEDFIDKNRSSAPAPEVRSIKQGSRPFDVCDFEKLVEAFEGRGKRPFSNS